jgi:hypothetical protein
MERRKTRVYIQDETTLIPFCNSFYTKNIKERELLCEKLSDNMQLDQRMIYDWFVQHFPLYSSVYLLGKIEELLNIYIVKRDEIMTFINDLKMNIGNNASTIVSGQAKLVYCVERMKNVVTKFERLTPLECIHSDYKVPRLQHGYNMLTLGTILPKTSLIINNFFHYNLDPEMKRRTEIQIFPAYSETGKLLNEQKNLEKKDSPDDTIIESDSTQPDISFPDWNEMGLLSDEVMKPKSPCYE